MPCCSSLTGPSQSERLACLQAHYINNRTMEIFRGIRSAGQPSLAQQIVKAMPPLNEWRKFIYCETATGDVYGEVDHFPVCMSMSCFTALHANLL